MFPEPITDPTKLSRLTKTNISHIVDYLGVEFVINATNEELSEAYRNYKIDMVDTGKSWNPPTSIVNGGALTGFRGNGIVLNGHETLTDFGIESFKYVAQEKQNGVIFQT